MAIFYQPPEPRQAYPKVLPQTQGAQPRPAGPLGGSVNALTAIGVWATLAAVPMPVQKPLNVVPLTLKYGSQPVPQPPLSATQQNVAVRSWDLSTQTPPSLLGVAAIKGVAGAPAYVAFNPTNPAIGLWPQPDWRSQPGSDIAPLTLARGDSVPFIPQQIVSATVSWLAQSTPPSAAWNVPAVVQNFVPFSPQRAGGLTINWSAQSAPPSAAWNVPVVAQTIVLNGSVRQTSWDSARQEPPRPVAIATLTLPRGDSVPFFRPPIFWPAPDWPYQSEENNAGWNFIPPVVSQPTPYVRFRVYLTAAAVWWPTQHAPPVAAFANVVQAALDRAIAHSDGTDSLVSLSDASGTLIQNSGIASVTPSDSKTIQLITGNSGTVSLDSDG